MKTEPKKKQKLVNLTPKKLQEKIEKFEDNNPELLKAMRLFDISMSHYEQSLKSLEPVKTFTSNSTKTL